MSAEELKRHFAEFVDSYYHTSCPTPLYPGEMLLLPVSLSKEALLLGDRVEVYMDGEQEYSDNAWMCDGVNLILRQSVARCLIVATGAARWEFCLATRRWWLTALDPDYYEKITTHDPSSTEGP